MLGVCDDETERKQQNKIFDVLMYCNRITAATKKLFSNECVTFFVVVIIIFIGAVDFLHFIRRCYQFNREGSINVAFDRLQFNFLL